MDAIKPNFVTRNGISCSTAYFLHGRHDKIIDWGNNISQRMNSDHSLNNKIFGVINKNRKAVHLFRIPRVLLITLIWINLEMPVIIYIYSFSRL